MMNYKRTLIERANRAQTLQPEQKQVLDHIDVYNRDNYRAWRRKLEKGEGHVERIEEGRRLD